MDGSWRRGRSAAEGELYPTARLMVLGRGFDATILLLFIMSPSRGLSLLLHRISLLPTCSVFSVLELAVLFVCSFTSLSVFHSCSVALLYSFSLPCPRLESFRYIFTVYYHVPLPKAPFYCISVLFVLTILFNVILLFSVLVLVVHFFLLLCCL